MAGDDVALGGVGEVLDVENVVIGLESVPMAEAIDHVGSMLVGLGVCDEAYAASMHDREATVSTFLGSGVAMPHGTFAAKDSILGTAIVVAQYPDGIDWDGQGPVHLVIGLAAKGDDHVTVLSQIAEVLQDEELSERLWTLDDREALHAALTSEVVDDDDEDELDGTIVITNPAGLHARPATLVVELAKAADGQVTISKGGKTAKANSIMALLSLGAVTGDTVVVDVTGSSDPGSIIAGIAEILTSEEH